MCRSEGVADVYISERGEFPRKFGIVLRLALVEPEIFQQYHVAFLHLGDHPLDLIPYAVGGHFNLFAQKFAEPL